MTDSFRFKDNAEDIRPGSNTNKKVRSSSNTYNVRLYSNAQNTRLGSNTEYQVQTI